MYVSMCMFCPKKMVTELKLLNYCNTLFVELQLYVISDQGCTNSRPQSLLAYTYILYIIPIGISTVRIIA